jgi:hypothetical protein
MTIHDYIEQFLERRAALEAKYGVFAVPVSPLRALLEKYMSSPEGRVMVLQALWLRARDRYDSLRAGLHTERADEFRHPWTESLFYIECEPLLGSIPLEERESDEYQMLFEVVERARALFPELHVAPLVETRPAFGRSPVKVPL